MRVGITSLELRYAVLSSGPLTSGIFMVFIAEPLKRSKPARVDSQNLM